MTNFLITPKTALALACALSLGLLTGAAYGQINPADAGYLTDSQGKVARSGFNLCWRAGTKPTQAQIDECNPAPVQLLAQVGRPAPQETPVAAAALIPASEKVTLDADTLFKFDRSDLLPAGRTALDEFVAKLGGVSIETVIVIGHADRFGSPSYNQRLSERRTESVKTYLVDKGIPANRIQTAGKGETQPITKPGDCLGKKSAKVIACLQPDRRVDVELIGTRNAQ